MSAGAGIAGKEVAGAVVVASGGEPEIRKKKRKKKKGRGREADGSSEPQSGIGSGVEGDAKENGVVAEGGDAAGVSFGGDGACEHLKNDETDSSAPAFYTNGSSKTTGAEWTEAPVPDATEGVSLDLDRDADEDPTSFRRKEIEDWLACQTSHAYHNLSNKLRDKVADHLLGYKYAEEQPDRDSAIRLIIWKAVIRASYFWIEPDTGLPVGKPKPVRTPDGVFASNFDVFLMCCAERADRVGRDLPEPEHVKKVEDDVRRLFKVVKEQGFKEQLEHLAFLLLIDEGQGRELTAEEMQERMGLAFSDSTVAWDGFEIVRCTSTTPPIPTKGSKLSFAESIWQDIVAQL